MVLIRLDELPELNRRWVLFGPRFWHWARFRRQDYLGEPGIALGDAVKSRIADTLGLDRSSVEGEVYFFGHLRYLGFYFSPLNLYFLRQQDQMRYMVAEVSNTPWNQRHYYVIDLANRMSHDKEFHVSPFNPMDQRYTWRIRPPGKDSLKSMVHLELTHGDSLNPVFDATMVLKRLPLNQRNLARVLIGTPTQTLTMVLGIYWQALRLFLKKIPFHQHPDRLKPKADVPR